MIEIIIYIFTFPCFQFLLIQFCVFPSVTKCIIDPYYREHPGEDIERRKDLGLEIEELQIPEKQEEEKEEESENIFED